MLNNNSITEINTNMHILFIFFVRVQSLLDLHKMGSKHNDVHLCDYLEGHFLKEQVESINKLAKHHTNLVRVGDGLGVFLFDKELR